MAGHGGREAGRQRMLERLQTMYRDAMQHLRVTGTVGPGRCRGWQSADSRKGEQYPLPRGLGAGEGEGPHVRGGVFVRRSGEECPAMNTKGKKKRKGLRGLGYV